MNSIAIAAVAGLVGLSMISLTTSMARVDHKSEQQHANAVLDQYRMFMFVADQYMKTAPTVSVNTTVSWEVLRASPSAPPGAQQVNMPAGWRIVQTPADWVACTEMDERSVALIGQLAPSATSGSGTGTASLTPVSGAGGSAAHVVVGDTQNAAALAGLCS